MTCMCTVDMLTRVEEIHRDKGNEDIESMGMDSDRGIGYNLGVNGLIVKWILRDKGIEILRRVRVRENRQIRGGKGRECYHHQ